MTAEITRTTIQSNAHKNVFDMVNSKSNVADPKNTSPTSGRKFVYDVEPFLKDVRFEDLPYVVVERPMNEKSNFSCNGKVKNVMWSLTITVRTAHRGVNDRDGQGISDMHAICDDLEETFASETNKQTLRNNNMYDLDLEQVSQDDGIDVQGKSVLETTYELEFWTRMQVSA